MNPYRIATATMPPPSASAPTRPDQVRQAQMMSRRKQYLPNTYGVWWMATLVFFVLTAGLGAYHSLEYAGYDPTSLTMDDLREKYVFLSLSGALLGSLFLIWVVQNTARGLTSKQPDPVGSYNNVFGVMMCLLIVCGMKMSSDVVTQHAEAADGGQLTWLRANAYGSASEDEATESEVVVDENDASDSTGSLVPVSDPSTASTTGRNLPQARPRPHATRTGSHTEVRLGDPSKSVMADSMRAFQSAAGRALRADRDVENTPQPDLKTVSSSGPIMAVGEAHFEAFEAHRAMGNLAKTLPDTARQQMLEAGTSPERTEEQVASLVSLLSLETASVIHHHEAMVHRARAAYAGFLGERFGEWSAENGKVRFDEAQPGKHAVELQREIRQRELEFKAAKFDASGN